MTQALYAHVNNKKQNKTKKTRSQYIDCAAARALWNPVPSNSI
jgi:hypothetical protein